MPIVDPMILEFDRESSTTRKVLQRVPDDKLGFRPHAKSRSLGELANHVATLPGFVASTLMTGFEGAIRDRDSAASSAELMKTFEENRGAVMSAMSGLDDAAAMQMWTFRAGGRTILELPRVAFLRMILLNHVIHHRGQLSVYLRLLDIPVPSIYGPSADESPFG